MAGQMHQLHLGLWLWTLLWQLEQQHAYSYALLLPACEPSRIQLLKYQ